MMVGTVWHVIGRAGSTVFIFRVTLRIGGDVLAIQYRSLFKNSSFQKSTIQNLEISPELVKK